MGKATITSGGEDGSYQIRLDYGKDERTKRVNELTATIEGLTTKIAEEQIKYDAEKLKVDAATTRLNSAIDAYVSATKASANPADWKPALEAFKARQKELFDAQSKFAPIGIKLDELSAEKAQAIKDRSYWEGLELEANQQAW